MRSALSFSGAMLCCSLWATLYGLEMASLSLPFRVLCAQLRFLPLSFMPLAWFTVAVHHTRHSSVPA